jgi:hypothetical protein
MRIYAGPEAPTLIKVPRFSAPVTRGQPSKAVVLGIRARHAGAHQRDSADRQELLAPLFARTSTPGKGE